MKPIGFVLLLALGMTASGCSKINDIFTSYLRVQTDGTSWSASFASGTSLAGRLTIAGTSTNGGRVLNLIVPSGIDPGEYSLSAIGSYTAQYKPDGIDLYTASSGTLTITEHNVGTKEIKGTFAFSALNVGGNTIQLTGGTFSVSYL